MLVRDERLASIGAVERLLHESDTTRVTDPDSAAALLSYAKSIADLALETFDDSLAWREIRFRESLTPQRARVVVRGWSFLASAREHSDAGRYREAVASLPKLDAAVVEAGDPYLATRGAHQAGRCLRDVADIEGARLRFEAARDRARGIGDFVAEERALAALGMLLMEQDRGEEAGEVFRDVLAKARELEDHEMVVWTQTMIGSSLRLRGDLSGARDIYAQTLSVARARGMASSEVSLLVNLGALRSQLGDDAGAFEDLEAALELGRRTGTLSRRTELNAGTMMASILTRRGRYSQALALQREALAASSESGLADLEAVFRTQIGETYQLLGRPEDAMAHFEHALGMFRAGGMPRHVAVVLKDLAQSEVELGRSDDAIEHLTEAVGIMEKQKVPSLHTELLVELGRVRQKSGDLVAAESTLELACTVAQSSGNPMQVAESERALAASRAARQDTTAALALLDSAIARGRACRSQPALLNALADRARLSRKMRSLEEADSLLGEATALVEEIRGRQSGEAVRSGVLAAHASLFADRVGVLYEIGRVEETGSVREEAFRVSEAGRARALVDALSGTDLVSGPSAGPLQQRERELATLLAESQSALSRAASSDSWNAAAFDSLEARVAEVGREHRELLDEIGARNPSFGALVGSRPPLRVADVRTRVLRRGQTLLQYVVGEEESYVFLVGQDRFRLEHVDAGRQTLAALVEALRTSAPDSGTSAARELDRLLIAPVAADIVDGERLLVSPDGPLHHLPFAALHDGREFLIERHALAYAPSAGAIDREIRGRRSRRGTVALAVGNPATFRTDELLADRRDASRWSFGELPYAEEEARRVASRFQKSTLLTGSSASEESVKAMAPDVTLMHFATHGVLDEREPMLSGILLAQDDDEAEDGLLQAHEVVGMRVPADLVTLSACETGRGRIQRGEGVIGLTRAFIHAGTRGLLLSLWVVPDRSTMELMESFYEAYLESRDPPDVALQRAQVAAIAAGRPMNEWAGFLFVGEADSWVGQGMSPGRVAAVTFGLAGATALLFAARRRHARR